MAKFRYSDMGLIIGTFPLLFSLPLSIVAGRLELFLPLMAAAPSIMILSVNLKALKFDKNPVYINAQDFIRVAILILGGSIAFNLLTGILGALFRTGFSTSYGFAMLVGLLLPLIGSVATIIGVRFGKKTLGKGSSS
jgi:hypothetical protein